MKIPFFFLIVAIIIFSTPVDAANNIAVNSTGNSTPYESSAVWSQLPGANLTLETGAGTVSILVSMEARVNYTGAVLYGRIVKDSTEISRSIISSTSYNATYSFEMSAAETAGTHTYGLEVYSTAGKKGIINRYNMTARFMQNYDVNASAQIARAQVIGQEGVDTWQNNSIALIEGTDTTQNATLTASQINDTYFNSSTFPDSTDFRNDTVGSKEATWDAKESAISSSTANKFWGWDKTFRDLIASYITDFASAVNITVDRNLSNFTNVPGFVTNVTVNINLSNATNTLADERLPESITVQKIGVRRQNYSYYNDENFLEVFPSPAGNASLVVRPGDYFSNAFGGIRVMPRGAGLATDKSEISVFGVDMGGFGAPEPPSWWRGYFEAVDDSMGTTIGTEWNGTTDKIFTIFLRYNGTDKQYIILYNTSSSYPNGDIGVEYPFHMVAPIYWTDDSGGACPTAGNQAGICGDGSAGNVIINAGSGNAVRVSINGVETVTITSNYIIQNGKVDWGVLSVAPSATGTNNFYVNSSKSIPNICQSTGAGTSNWVFAHNGSAGC